VSLPDFLLCIRLNAVAIAKSITKRIALTVSLPPPISGNMLALLIIVTNGDMISTAINKNLSMCDYIHKLVMSMVKI